MCEALQGLRKANFTIPDGVRAEDGSKCSKDMSLIFQPPRRQVVVVLFMCSR